MRSISNFKKTIFVSILPILLLMLIFTPTENKLWAQSSDPQKYQKPPQTIADLVDAPPTPYVSIDPTHQWMLLQEYPNLISIDELAQPELRLAGMRMNPKNHGPSRSSYRTGLKLLEIGTATIFEIKDLPKKVKIRNVSWSPDGKHFAFIISKQNGQDLWIVDVAGKTAKKLA